MSTKLNSIFRETIQFHRKGNILRNPQLKFYSSFQLSNSFGNEVVTQIRCYEIAKSAVPIIRTSADNPQVCGQAGRMSEAAVWILRERLFRLKNKD